MNNSQQQTDLQMLADWLTYMEDLYHDKYITELNEYNTDIY